MSSLPLPLAHILEEEYARLHGPEDVVERRWILHAREIIDARELARKLAAKLGPSRTPPGIGAWENASGHDPAYKQAIAVEITAILESIAPSRWLFEDPAFKEAKKEPYAKLDEATNHAADAVFNLNRQMFDSLFDDEVRHSAHMRFAEIVGHIHERARNGEPRTSLSISGGGIRSATFALGVLTGLARNHILEKFDFLSTVSGGGYIGSWLSSWVRRDAWGIRGVAASLAAPPRDALDPEPPPVSHLRAYSNYLTPRLGFLSADTWSLIATYLRNLLLNWVVIIPLLTGLLAVPRIVFTAIVRDAYGSLDARGEFEALMVGLVLLVFGLFVLVTFRPISNGPKTKAFTDGKFIIWILLPLMGSAIALVLAWAWYSSNVESPFLPIWYCIAFTSVSTLAAFMAFLVHFLRTPHFDISRERKLARIVGELGGSIVAGLLGGTLVWVLATRVFDSPVREVQIIDTVRWPILDEGGISATTASYVVFGVPLLLVVLFLQAVVFVGAASHTNHDFDREWWARASGWVCIGALAWLALSAITIYGPVGIYHVPRALSALGGAAGIFAVLAGNSGKTEAGSKGKGEESTTTKATNFALALAVPIFVLYILSLISLGTTTALRQTMVDEAPRVPADLIAQMTRQAERAHREYDATVANKPAKIREVPLANKARVRSIEHLWIVEHTDPLLMILIALGSPILALLVSRCIGVNVFSMHAMYRNRLVRAYLGASRWRRDPNRFTGFDPRDNVSMHDLRPEYCWTYSFRDVDASLAALKARANPRIGVIADEIEARLGNDAKRVFSEKTASEVRRRALYTALNTVIADANLTNTPDSVVRPLHNRRFIELAFGDDQIIPAAMPLLCAQDVIVHEDVFRAAFEAGASPAADALRRFFNHDSSTYGGLLNEINDVIATDNLDHVAPFDAVTIDTEPFELTAVGPVHRMILTRLRIQAAFPGLIAPLHLARPLHIINMCLNLTTGSNLAWQQRKGDTFTVSPVSAGNHRLGYRDTRHYGDVSVGTAVTISGAAASPNMGYHSSPALSFLLTLFNVRLGWWLGNPGLAGNGTWQRRNPRSSILPYLYEATGNSNDAYAYVYLSDGGHFENLGIYEMVLRRSHRIVVSDGGCDPEYVYEDLGNAVRKIRIDLGIPLDITHMGIIPPESDKPGKYCAIGTIDYRAVDGPDAVNGTFLYIKPVVYSDEGPRDVLNYAKTSTAFPHEPTSDQWFSESQFESYRRLGLFAIEQICSGMDAPIGSVDQLIEAAKKYLQPQQAEVV